MIRIKIFLSLFPSPITFPCFRAAQNLLHSLFTRFRAAQNLLHSLPTRFRTAQNLFHSLPTRFRAARKQEKNKRK